MNRLRVISTVNDYKSPYVQLEIWPEKKTIYSRIILVGGKVTKVECKDHAYAWSGKIPCTGDLKCIFCGKVK